MALMLVCKPIGQQALSARQGWTICSYDMIISMIIIISMTVVTEEHK